MGWALVACLNALLLVVGLAGCALDRNQQGTDQRVEDSRMAERVREALAATEYKFDGVRVAASEGVVQLSGFVNTNAQRSGAEEVTRKVGGVKGIENNLTVKD